MPETMWRRSEDCVGSPIDDALVLLDLESGQYVALNATASDIWEAIAEPAPESRIVESLTAKYQIDAATCAGSVRRLLEHLSGLGLAKAVG